MEKQPGAINPFSFSSQDVEGDLKLPTYKYFRVEHLEAEVTAKSFVTESWVCITVIFLLPKSCLRVN